MKLFRLLSREIWSYYFWENIASIKLVPRITPDVSEILLFGTEVILPYFL